MQSCCQQPLSEAEALSKRVRQTCVEHKPITAQSFRLFTYRFNQSAPNAFAA
jgi:hypothetical protein